MESKVQALNYFEEGFLCSQSILMAYGPCFGLDREIAARLAASFGGGIARRGETCGAVLGAFMVLGLIYGHTSAEDIETKEKAYLMVNAFIAEFQAHLGSIKCRDLLEIDINTPEGLELARDSQVFTSRCPGYVSKAAEILDSMISQQ
jgi:C_GCAxxG_C_C family probable redox protein